MNRRRIHRPSTPDTPKKWLSLPGRWIAVVLIAFVLVALTAWRWQVSMRVREQASAPPGTVAVGPVSPPILDSPYLNTERAVAHVGSARCVECHPGQHASYLHTAHSRSMNRVDWQHEPPDGEFSHAPSGRRYRSYRQEGQLRHRESMVLPNGDEVLLCDYPLSYLVGSGRFTRSYLVEDAGFLIESPITWYASLARWDMSPGFDRPAHRSFYRTVESDCLFCHAGAVEPIEQNEQRLRLGELAIGCERCHGPGALHVARREDAGSIASESDVDFTIVNPRRLNRERAEAICHQCHVTGAVRVAVSGRGPLDFRPGLRWQDFVVDFKPQADSRQMTVVGHVEQLQRSRCYQADPSLSCLTCHAAHSPVEPAQAVPHHRAICLKCHVEPSCGIELSDRTARNGNHCAGCHMPQSPTDIDHVAFTHHRIGIHEPPVAQPAIADSGGSAPPLAPLLDLSHHSSVDRQLTLGLAYLQYLRDHPEEVGTAREPSQARQAIQAALNLGVVDARIALARAEGAGDAGNLVEAERWARHTLTERNLSSKERISASRLLAGLALQQNRLDEALSRLTELTSLCRDPRDWLLLGVCQQRRQDTAAAITAFERVLAIDPAQPETYELLAPLYAACGQPGRESWCVQQSQHIRQARPSRDR